MTTSNIIMAPGATGAIPSDADPDHMHDRSACVRCGKRPRTSDHGLARYCGWCRKAVVRETRKASSRRLRTERLRGDPAYARRAEIARIGAQIGRLRKRRASLLKAENCCATCMKAARAPGASQCHDCRDNLAAARASRGGWGIL